MSTDPPPRESLPESEQNPSAPSSASGLRPWGSSGYAIVAVMLTPPALSYLVAGTHWEEGRFFGSLFAILGIGSPLAAVICACLENRISRLSGVAEWISHIVVYIVIEIGLCFGGCVAAQFTAKF